MKPEVCFAIEKLTRSDNVCFINKLIVIFYLIGYPVKEFVGLRAKMYSFLIHDEKGTQIKKAKGISKSVVIKDLNHFQYRDCLFEKQRSRHKMQNIRSDNHVLYLKSINKISLSSFDDKRWWLAPFGVSSYSYGHYKIDEYKKKDE